MGPQTADAAKRLGAAAASGNEGGGIEGVRRMTADRPQDAETLRRRP